MKLLLCSDGFHTSNTVKACVELVGKPQDKIKVGVINEAYAVETGDKRWVLDNLNDIANNFPAGMDMVNLLALPASEVIHRLEDCDVLYVVGGHTDYLMHVFLKTGFCEVLPKLLETKVYVGSSAGSMVLGKRVSSEAYLEIYGEVDDYGVDEYMGLVDFAIKPHLGSELFPKNRPEILTRVAQNMPFPVYGLQDDSAIIINGDEQSFTGTEPFLANLA